jgi:tetratricopeptide (TPR) repeat protein
MKYLVYISLTLVLFTKANAQTKQELKQHLIDGVEAFNAEEHESAVTLFGSGGSLENYEDIAAYNRGRSLLETEDLESAISAFEQAIELSDNPILKSRSNYNIGNASLYEGELETAIESYKSALRLDPNFDDARHNLANAYKLLQEQQEQEQQEQGEDGEDGEQEEEQEDDGDDGEQEDDGDDGEQEDDGDDGEQEDQDENQNDQQKEKPVEKQISKEEMERILENLENEEEKIQAKLMKQKGSGKKKVKKEW